MTATEKRDKILVARAVLKGIVADLECSLGVDAALPVTLPVLEAIQAADGMVAGPRRE